MKIIITIILTSLTLCFAFAQNDLVDIKLNPSCTNNSDDTYLIELFIKSKDINSTIRVAEQNYRFVFNRDALQNPRILKEGTTFNGLVINGSEVSAYGIHSLEGTLGNTISYNVELEGGVGTLLQENEWTKVGTIEFDVIDHNASKDFSWLDLDQFPPTVIYNLVGEDKELLQPNFLETGSLYQDAEVIQAFIRRWQHPTCGLQNGLLQLNWTDFSSIETIQISIDGGQTFTAIPDRQQNYSVENLSGGDYDIWVKLGASETACAVRLDDINLRTATPEKDGLRAVYTCSNNNLRLKELDYDAQHHQFKYRTYNDTKWSAWKNTTTTTNGIKDIKDLATDATKVQYRTRVKCGGYWSAFSKTKVYSLPACRLSSSTISNEIEVYPNPFTNAFFVDFESEIDATAQLRVTDLIGKTIYEENVQFTIGHNSHQIELNPNLSNGIYMISLQVGEQPVRTIKMIKD